MRRTVTGQERPVPIEAAGMIDGLPLTLNISNSGVAFEGEPEPRAGDVPVANMYYITILYGISAHDPLTYVCAIALMAAVAFVA
jgi:hypothetical protein